MCPTACMLIVLDKYYGRALMYHGEFSAYSWPPVTDIQDGALWGERMQSVEGRFAALSDGNPLEYFIVTDFGELELQPELRTFLGERYPVLASADDYVIYDLRRQVRSYR